MPDNRYEPTWESLQKYTVPDWFKDAKLGIFIHWGVYAVPAFDNEWYPRFMYRDELSKRGINYYRHHVETWGHPSRFGYKDFIPLFTAERWDPAAWVDLFQAAGARYVVPVAEHHDGFPMYGTSLTPWNAAQMGPRRDVVGELGRVVRAAGLKFGVSSHRAFNWRYYTFADDFDTTDPANAGLYGPAHDEGEPADAAFLADWYGRTLELMDRFEPDVLWFDFGWHFEEFAPYRPQVLAAYYNRALNWGREVVLQYKDKIPDGAAVLDIERGKLDDIRPHYWQTDTSLSTRSWCYIEDDEFKSTGSVIHDLVDIVSKNGNLLLNVGPRPDGTIPEEAADILHGLGAWLAVNGEAIYGSRPWTRFGEGETRVATGHMTEGENQPFTAEDIRFTTRGNTLYAICLGQPTQEVVIRSLATGSGNQPAKIGHIELLGSDEPLDWSQDEDALRIGVPSNWPSKHAVAFKILRNHDHR